ncbi:hypothetical protein Phum_PHUM383030 [Pediculus humanus corporis]|uniref:Uncharacterized protein n=1 Tax=Pediculus humanus subsp. corporis TaxID=121224 RepID=E0VQS3_PEDHC|nr:uncharacterized protein Phum_PHUM383030 [Pediculus humanus corporis]EEB15729.1 hypothetical protein Phum_PHUM383030 [Pediculus humanus corporis]
MSEEKWMENSVQEKPAAMQHGSKNSSTSIQSSSSSSSFKKIVILTFLIIFLFRSFENNHVKNYDFR